MDLILIILAMLLLLITQGFFSGSEIALVHADKLKLHHRAAAGHRGAALVLKMFKKPEVLLGTTLVGTNISIVTLTTLGTLLMIHFLGERGDLYAFLIFTPVFLILGEVVPKSVYQQEADKLAPIIIYPLRAFSLMFYPIVFVFSKLARLGARLAGVESPRRDVFMTREQIRTLVEMSEQAANIDVFDRDRIMRVVRYADTTVGEAMIPINEMTMISRDENTRHGIQLAMKRGHFRIPVHTGMPSQIEGILALALWDLMDPQLSDRPLSELVTPAHYVTPRQLLDEVLPILQQREDHMAVVVDEFGAAIGMITLEDVLAEIVGEAVDVGYTFEAHLPHRKYRLQKLSDDVYVMDGRVPITEVNEALGVNITAADSYTVGGMVIAHLRHLPAAGEIVVQSGCRFSVEEATERGILKLRAEKIG